MHYLLLFIELAIIVLIIAGMWKVFEKAGQPGWAAVVPIYNIWILIQIAKKPEWWIIMFFIPCVNIAFAFMIAMEIAQKFGKDTGYAIGLFLLPMIFYPMLGFGDERYIPDA